MSYELTPLPALDDAEGPAVPDGLAVFDAHVHVFPPGFFEAIWRWFDRHAWGIRYRLHAEDVVTFLRARGVRRFTGLHYAHKPDVARLLNRFASDLGRVHPELVPLATVYPGEPDAAAILDEAFGPLGLRGVKLHCHVQRMGADDPRLDVVYAKAEDAGLPVVIHAGRQPASPAYGLDTRALCAASQVGRVLERHPRLTLVVPHLGIDELEEYAALLDVHEHLWLDTTMAIGAYFPIEVPRAIFPGRARRLLYGTDFPNIPYAWDRELKVLLGTVPEADRAAILWDNAQRLWPA